MGKDLDAGKDSEGRRRKGQQKMGWLDGITYSMDMNLGKLQETIRDSGWCVAVQGVTKSQTWLADWTTAAGGECRGPIPENWCFFFFFKIFWCEPFLKSLLNLLPSCFCFMCWDFWPQGIWDLSSLTRDQAHTPCLGRWSLNHWAVSRVPDAIIRGSPLFPPQVDTVRRWPSAGGKGALPEPECWHLDLDLTAFRTIE